jgi:hypothetical protein
MAMFGGFQCCSARPPKERAPPTPVALFEQVLRDEGDKIMHKGTGPRPTLVGKIKISLDAPARELVEKLSDLTGGQFDVHSIDTRSYSACELNSIRIRSAIELGWRPELARLHGAVRREGARLHGVVRREGARLSTGR